MGPGGGDLDLGGGGGADDDFIDVKFPNPNTNPRPGFGTDQSGKGYGGGGIRMMDFGTDWTKSMIGRGFSPANFGLPGQVSDYVSAPPSGADAPGETNTPTEDAPAGEEERGFFGGTLGPKLRNAFPPKLRKFLGGIASLHPATRNAVFLGRMAKGYQGAEDKGAFLRKIGTGLAMRKMMGNVGLSSMQRSGIGSAINVARGDQNWQQGLGSFATNAAFSGMLRNVLPKAYQSGGMPAVYALMSAVKMMRQRAQRRVRSGLAGPGGGG